MKKLHSMWIGLVVLAFGSQAFADICKAPQVQINNDGQVTIKVTKIQYFDGCDNKWRTENVPETEITAGSSRTLTDNLEFVGNCPINKFKLFRANRSSTGSAYGGYSWTNETFADEGAKVCNTKVLYTLHTP